MSLRESFESAGHWLFRRRGYLPLLVFLPLLVDMRHFERPLHSHLAQEVWEFCCLFVCLCGLAVRAVTIGSAPLRTSGRNTKHQVAAVLNTTGMYSVVRHPLYLGNSLIWLGISLVCLEWHEVIICALVLCVYYERIMFAEEEYLRRKFGPAFDDWAARTPTILPRLSQWQPPALPFSWRKVLRQEYTGLLCVIAVFFGLEVLEHFVVEHQLVFEPQWLVLGGAGLLVYLTMRTLKRRTKLLNVKGKVLAETLSLAAPGDGDQSPPAKAG